MYSPAMDFFDPVKQKKHAIRLLVGYGVIGVTLILATIILLYQARGYWLDKNGNIIRNGLVFVSSRPREANIYLNSQRYKDATNARLNLASGQYLMELKREGYRDWKRVLTVEGGSVERFDYPLLFPITLTPEVTKQYEAPPLMSTSSPDRRWLLVANAGQNSFDLLDMDQRQPEVRTLTVSEEILAAGSTTKSWEVVEWAKDNRRVLLKRSFDQAGQAGNEYILLDREAPETSLNLSVTLGFTPDKIELRDRNYDQYYLHDQDSSQLFTATLSQPTPQPYLSDVLAFTSDRTTVAYVTAVDAPAEKVLVRIQRGTDPALTIRQFPAGTNYLLDMAIYSDDLYVAAGAVSDNRVFLYNDPLGMLRSHPTEPPVPVQILKVAKPNRVSFSANSRFVAAENGDTFSVYDAETDRGYVYQTGLPLDKPQQYASWLDSFHLAYVSGGEVVVFNADGTNLQKLSPALPGLVPVFDRSYRYLYTISPEQALTRTPLLTPEDL
jgi:hypothetical protein